MGVRVQFGEGRLLAEKFNALGFRRKGIGHSGAFGFGVSTPWKASNASQRFC